MEGSCSTGQSPQRAVVPVEEEEELLTVTEYESLALSQNTITANCVKLL
jgi:hypothetical protein